MTACTLHLDVDRPAGAYAPGEVVTGTLTITANRDVECPRVRVSSGWCIDNPRPERRGGKRRIELQVGALRSGERWQERIAVPLASEGPPSHHGLAVRIVWAIRVDLAVRRGLDLTMEKRIEVRPDHGRHPSAGAPGPPRIRLHDLEAPRLPLGFRALRPKPTRGSDDAPPGLLAHNAFLWAASFFALAAAMGGVPWYLSPSESPSRDVAAAGVMLFLAMGSVLAAGAAALRLRELRRCARGRRALGTPTVEVAPLVVPPGGTVEVTCTVLPPDTVRIRAGTAALRAREWSVSVSPFGSANQDSNTRAPLVAMERALTGSVERELCRDALVEAADGARWTAGLRVPGLAPLSFESLRARLWWELEVRLTLESGLLWEYRRRIVVAP